MKKKVVLAVILAAFFVSAIPVAATAIPAIEPTVVPAVGLTETVEQPAAESGQDDAGNAAAESGQSGTDSTEINLAEMVQVSATEALSVALADAGVTEAEVTVTGISLRRNGQKDDETGLAYSVQFQSEEKYYRYSIDAKSGEILSKEEGTAGDGFSFGKGFKSGRGRTDMIGNGNGNENGKVRGGRQKKSGGADITPGTDGSAADGAAGSSNADGSASSGSNSSSNADGSTASGTSSSVGASGVSQTAAAGGMF